MNRAPIKNIQIDPELHQRIKVRCVMHGITIREFTEMALLAALDGSNDKRLVDSAPAYETQEAS